MASPGNVYAYGLMTGQARLIFGYPAGIGQLFFTFFIFEFTMDGSTKLFTKTYRKSRFGMVFRGTREFLFKA